MTIQTVRNRSNTPVVIDTAGHIVDGYGVYVYDDATISPANFAIIQAQLNNGRLILLTSGVTVPPPSQGASYVAVALVGNVLTFTDSLGGTTAITLPSGGGGGPITSANITDASSIGKSVLTAADAAAVRAAIGVGAGSGTVTSNSITDATTVGKSLLTSTDATAAKTTLSLTKADVGLNNVNNTADANKPISSATQTALDTLTAAQSGFVKTSDVTPATDVVTTSSLATTLAPYAQTADVNAARTAALGPYLKTTDLTDLTNRVAALEAAAGQTPTTRPTRPGTGAQPSFWLRGDQITQSSGTISAWTDNVGNKTYTVPTGRVAPTYLATGINNKPAALFSKSAISGLFYAKPLKAEGQTIFVVFSVPALATGAGLVQATASADNTQTNLNVNTYVHSGNAIVAGVNGNTGSNGFSGTNISAANVGNVGRFTYGIGGGVGTNSAKALTSSLNGGVNGSAAATQGFTAALSDGFSLGNAGTATTANAVDLRIAEVIIFDSELSSADKVTWTQYLGTTYGITVGSN